jgi:hypothetical protein
MCSNPTASYGMASLAIDQPPRSAGTHKGACLNVIASSVAATREGTTEAHAAISQMTTKPRVGDIANTCKFGRMTLPAYGCAHADLDP